MAINDNIIKIVPYKGLYFLDKNKLFEGKKEISTAELQRRVKAPYTIVLKYYVEKGKIKTEQKHITNDNHTIKRVCDELMIDRGKAQINKNFPDETPKNLTLQQLFDEYIQNKQQSEKWKKEQKYYLEAHLSSILSLPISDIKTKRLQAITNDLLKTHKPRTTHLAKQILRSMFNYAIKCKYATDNPAKDIEIPTYDNQVYFELSDEDADRLYNSIVNYPDLKAKAVFTFLVNGRRRGETLQMKWEYLNFETKQYKTPYTITKPGKTLTYPLTEDIISALNDLGIKKKGYIFESDNDKGHIKDIRWHWEKLLKIAGIKQMRLHDLRHLIGYRASKAGVPIQAISKVLGHSSIQVTQRYSNTDTATIANVLEIVKGKAKI